MNWVDYAILVIILLSAIISVVRGFVREALSLIGWVLAFWVAITFTEPLAALFGNAISVPSLRLAAAFLVLFVATLIVTSLINYFIGQLVEKTGLSGTDRMLGVVFGVARGAVIVGILVLLAGLTALPQDPWWGESMLLKHFEAAATEVRGFLPDNIADAISF